MSELHKFIFDGLPVRGMLVRLTGSWQEILKRRQAGGGYPAEVMQLLGEMTAAGALMQSNIKFNGALILQIFGDGPVKLAVAEVQPDLSLRATATVTGTVDPGSTLSQLVNVSNQGRCAITLDPRTSCRGSRPTRAWFRSTATSARRLKTSRKCWSTTCCRASSWTPS